MQSGDANGLSEQILGDACGELFRGDDIVGLFLFRLQQSIGLIDDHVKVGLSGESGRGSGGNCEGRDGWFESTVSGKRQAGGAEDEELFGSRLLQLEDDASASLFCGFALNAALSGDFEGHGSGERFGEFDGELICSRAGDLPFQCEQDFE